MIKGLWKMSVNFRIAAVLIMMVLLSGCRAEKPKEIPQGVSVIHEQYINRSSEKAEEYKNHFKSIQSVMEKTVSEPKVEQYKKDYWLLIADFMSGGFSTTQNLDYLNNEYPQEYYQYCIEDINGDGIPELMLGYGYNGYEPDRWEIYKTGNSYKECFVGSAMYYDREENILFDGYDGAEMSAFYFDGEKLIEQFSYYMDGDECTDDMEPDKYVTHFYYVDADYNKIEMTERTYRKRLSVYFKTDNKKFKGKRLTSENLADDLGIDRNFFEKERAYRSYLGLLHYFSKNTSFDYMKDYRYALVCIDNDDIPELVAVNNNQMELFYYRNGSWLQESGTINESGNEHYFSFFPKKNVYKSYVADWGNSQEEFYTIRDELIECALEIRKEVLQSPFDNGFQRDKNGDLLYNYCVDEAIVTDKECEAIRDTLYEVFDLGEEVRFEDLESFFYQDMMTYLEKETGYYYQ